MHGDKTSTLPQMLESPVEGLVAECSARAAEDDHVRDDTLRIRFRFLDERHTLGIVTDVTGVEQRAASSRVVLPQVCGGGGGCGEDVVDTDGERSTPTKRSPAWQKKARSA